MYIVISLQNYKKITTYANKSHLFERLLQFCYIFKNDFAKRFCIFKNDHIGNPLCQRSRQKRQSTIKLPCNKCSRCAFSSPHKINFAGSPSKGKPSTRVVDFVLCQHFGFRVTPYLLTFTTFAGLPATTLYAGTSLVTTLLAAITAPSPMVTFGKIVALSPIHTSFPIITGPLLVTRRINGGCCNVS